jgi:hypothetical protein
VEFTREELVWLLRCLNKIVSGPDAPTPDEIQRLTGATEDQLVALRRRIEDEVVPPPSVGERHVVIRVAGMKVGLDYAGPYFVEEWDGSQWREIGRAATTEELGAMGCTPPDIESMPRYTNRPRRE